MTNESEENSPSDGTLRKGSDPLGRTVRSKLQTQRQKLNHQINKEMLMRDGAVNLYRAATNRKLKEQVALELSFVNSNLQLLKEELSELNSEVEAYQNESYLKTVPMIPLGLKETKDLDFRIPFTDYILEHYSEDGDQYVEQVEEFNNLRQAIRTPTRNRQGVELLFEYYNQLYFIENRFFPLDKSFKLGIYFQWYDALTGVPSIQKSIAFEKGSVLFNIGALFSQIGAKQDRSTEAGVSAAIEYFQKSAGVFRYLSENFSHAPSNDMSSAVLTMLMSLMLSQAQECAFELKRLGGIPDHIEKYFEAAQEAVVVSEAYSRVHKDMMQTTVKDYIPYSWVSLILVKSQHFLAESQYYAATALLGENLDANYDKETLERIFPKIYVEQKEESSPKPNSSSQSSVPKVPGSAEDRINLGKAHLNQAVMMHEEAMRIHSLSKNLRKIDTLQEILRHAHERSLNKFTELEEEDDFFEMTNVPSIPGYSQHKAEPESPNFASVQVKDLFHNLGPLAIFNAHNKWTAPRTLTMARAADGFGFTVRGDSPVIIASVDMGSPADVSGMREGDFIIHVNEHNVKWSRHEEVIKLIVASANKLQLSVITPLGKEFLHPQDHRRPQSIVTQVYHSPQSTGSTTSDSSTEQRNNNKSKSSLEFGQGTGKKKGKSSDNKGSLGRKKGRKDRDKSLEKQKKKSGLFENKEGLW